MPHPYSDWSGSIPYLHLALLQCHHYPAQTAGWSMCLLEATLAPHTHAALLLCKPLTPRYSILNLLVLFCAASIVSSMISWAYESIKACAISCKQLMLHSTSSVMSTSPFHFCHQLPLPWTGLCLPTCLGCSTEP